MRFDGLLLRDVRRRRALTILQLAERSGVHRDTIHRLEVGETDPRPSTIRKLADALRVDPDIFFSDREPFSEKWPPRS